MNKNPSSRAPWFWGAVHNAVAHPLLALTFGARWANRFHNQTAERMEHDEDLNAAPEAPPFWTPEGEANLVAIERWEFEVEKWVKFTRVKSAVQRATEALAKDARPTRRTLGVLWFFATCFLIGIAFGLGRIAEFRRAERAETAAPAYVMPAPPEIQGTDFELVVLDPKTAQAEGRGLAELWLHHADGTASRAEVRIDGRGSVVHYRRRGRGGGTVKRTNQPLTLTLRALSLVACFAGDDPDTEVSIQYLPDRTAVDGEVLPEGLYGWLTEYPEEGCFPLFDEPVGSESVDDTHPPPSPPKADGE